MPPSTAHPVEQADLPAFLKTAIVAMVRSNERDLSARQFSVFLTCCTLPEPHTVRGLARQLKVAKPSITRAVDRLETAGLVQRERDLADRRSVNIVPTPAGGDFLKRLRSSLVDAAAAQSGTESSQAARSRRFRQR